jgi:hypothetical protein
MCRRASCDACGKPTWKGCGAHAEQVLREVPVDERCRCREEAALKEQAAAPIEVNAA